MSYDLVSWAAAFGINHNLSAQSQTVSSTALCQLGCNVLANLYAISSSVVCQLQVSFSFQTQTICLTTVCQLIFELSTQLSTQLQLVNSAVSSGANCQLGCTCWLSRPSAMTRPVQGTTCIERWFIALILDQSLGSI